MARTLRWLLDTSDIEAGKVFEGTSRERAVRVWGEQRESEIAFYRAEVSKEAGGGGSAH
jgi:hypothetical protein